MKRMKKNLPIRISLFAMLFMFTSNVMKAQDTPVATEEKANPMDTLVANVKNLNDNMSILKKIKFSGYIQAQFQATDSTGTKSFAGGDFPTYADKRFMLRRARLKAEYNGTNSQYVFQVDATEGGFKIKEIYLKYNIPALKNIFSLTVGNQNRPFGYEIGYSSGSSESPERGRMSQIIFNDEYDLGAMLTVQAPKSMPLLNAFKLEAGMFNGTGSGVADFDKQKDFISHLTFNKTFNEKINIGAGVSYYDGAWRQGSKYVYSMNDLGAGVNGFKCDSTATNIGSYTTSKRQYMGADLQINIDWFLGMTSLRGEYIQGQQPSIASAGPKGTANPAPTATNSSGAPTTTDKTYIRNFNGAYFYFVQNIGQTKHQLVAKFDWYDPNTKVAGNDVSAKIGTTSTNLSASDIKYSTLGVGYIYKATENLKFTLFYDMVKNETSTGMKGYTQDLKDNVLTCRVQYKF